MCHHVSVLVDLHKRGTGARYLISLRSDEHRRDTDFVKEFLEVMPEALRDAGFAIGDGSLEMENPS